MDNKQSIEKEALRFGIWLSNYCTSIGYDLWNDDATGNRLTTKEAYDLSVKEPKRLAEHPNLMKFKQSQSK